MPNCQSMFGKRPVEALFRHSEGDDDVHRILVFGCNLPQVSEKV